MKCSETSCLLPIQENSCGLSDPPRNGIFDCFPIAFDEVGIIYPEAVPAISGPDADSAAIGVTGI
jgi:hypothetical protein